MMGLKETLDHLKECGFRHIELMSTLPHMFARDMDKRQRENIRQLIEKRDSQLESLQPTYLDLNMISLNPAIQQESMRQMFENVDLAADLEARILVLVTGRRHTLLPMPFEKA